jgi:glycosyltransferase EpsF
MTDRRVRVLQIVHALGTGGAETWLMELLRLWSAQGHQRMDFLLTGGQPARFDDEARQLGAQLHYLRYNRANLAVFRREFRRLLEAGEYDAVHDHADYASGWHFLLAGRALPSVRVAHVHNPWLHITSNYAISPSRRLATAGGRWLVQRLATHVCGTSDDILRQYGFTPGTETPPHVSVVNCGIDVATFAGGDGGTKSEVRAEFGWSDMERIALFAGRLDPAMDFDDPRNHKNSWLAINIARVAIEKDSRVRLLMAGDGPSRDQLTQQVEEWGLAGKIRIVGIRNDVARLMRASDALLFPSRQEGLGMVAVEAQSARLPVLASTAVPREAVVVEELYHTMPLSAAPERWAERLIQVMDGARPSAAYCAAAVNASPFAIERSARALSAIYCSATHKAGHGAR